MECVLAGVRQDLSDANNQVILYFPNNVWLIKTCQYIYKITRLDNAYEIILKRKPALAEKFSGPVRFRLRQVLLYTCILLPQYTTNFIPFNYTIILV
jgi:hypothetical protein